MKNARTRNNRFKLARRTVFCLSLGLLLGCQTNASGTSPSPSSVASSTAKVAVQNSLTYTNEQLGLSFSYPPGYTVEEVEQGAIVWRDADYQNKEDFVEATPLTIGLEDNPENLSLMEWVQQRGYQIEGQIIEQSVASSDAVVFQWSGMWEFRSVVIARPQSNQFAIVTLDVEMEEYRGIFEEILATLTFL